MRKRRILWLLNHDTLSKFELPLIRDLGFEIFTPKIVPKAILQASGSVTYEYDQTLTIPEDDLTILNQYDFYSITEMPLHISNILNKHFATALTYTDSSFLILKKLIHDFSGMIFFRAFGVGLEKFKNYSELIDHYFTTEDKFKLKQINSRFVFSQCYPNLAEVEEKLYSDKAVYMPLGLPQSFYDIQGEWTGSCNQILFFCTRIKFVPQAERIYQEFKKNFKGFDYLIAGNQPVPVEDERVTGYLEREELNNLYRTCKVMYYHSTNPRHLHYHPLEAMIAGMPVIYMDGGLLSYLGGYRQSGRCKDIQEARIKIKSIMNGDTDLINKIRQDQQEILTKFSYNFNRKQWEENFLPFVTDIEANTEKEEKKMSLFLPINLERVHLDDYLELVALLSKGMEEHQPNNNIVLNVYRNNFDLESDFKSISNNNVSIREYEMKTLSKKETKDALSLIFRTKKLWNEEYLAPIDYAQNFIDTDYWFFLNPDLDQRIASMKPYGIYIDNLGDRYEESINSIRISNLKNASFIITCSNQTKTDLIKHLGINKDIIYTIPFVYSKASASQSTSKGKYTLVEVDIDKEAIIPKLLNDISDFYRLYDNNEQFKIILNSYNKTHLNFLNSLYDYINKSDLLKKNITLYVDLRNNEYDALYLQANNIYIPHNIKNINYKLVKASNYRKPIIVNDYPCYRDIENLLNSKFNYIRTRSNSNPVIEIFNRNFKFASIIEKKNSYNEDSKMVRKVWEKLI
ncbi:hypothetical protein ACXFAU_26810 [Paenibacillus glucanolyticus]